MAGGSLLLAIGVWRQRAGGEAAFAALARLGAWLTLTGGALTVLHQNWK